MLLQDDHFSVKSVDQVNKICSILFDHSEITYFHYAKVEDDGKVAMLSTNAAYLKHYWQFNHNEKYFSLLKPGVLFNLTSCVREIEEAKHYNLDYIMMIAIRQNCYYDLFCYATPVGKHNILYFYLNNLDILQKFGLYFTVQAGQLIKNAEKNYIISSGYNPYIAVPTKQLQFDRSQFRKLISDRKLYFKLDDFQNVSISKRQAEILYLSIRGKNSAEIALELGLSKRTVGHYLDKVKSKLGVSTKSELIEIVFDHFK